MAEYGNGVGQATGAGGGGSGATGVGGNQDVIDRLSGILRDGVDTIAALPPEMLIAGIIVAFLGLIILTRAF